ncbi:MAG: hypothetical protein CVV27_12475 [Candidatus Melainabacteria bacterium HGW-Melainabacteria-1]|nr:MAG: hypothetical protein CVV27_12475 [Candidatus Melainabacteria bacterium HGW-Melainabacteria-1]
MADNSSRERDLVLAPNEFAFISDQTKGNINVYVGPYKTSLANTDQPVFFNEQSKRFERCTLEQATQIFATAPEGWYITLKNPPREGNQPKNGTVNNLPDLQIGHKVNLPGPVSFALWPGQMARVLQGHHLRSNQYLLARVYDEESARRNWSQAVMKPQITGEEVSLAPAEAELTLGQELIIKGTEVSFYIPPTGIEVVRDANGHYVREAVTLERLEYCILLDEDGNKRYIQGPDVVFPKPTERFIEREGRVKFRAIELNENSGLYIKVIAPYEEGGFSYKVGDELFITGKEQMIYFPRPEHAIIKYGDQEIHYAVALPAGEGRYLLDRHSGQIKLVKGPVMLLPDPRREVIVRRILEPGQVRLWFPGNTEALEYNQQLKRLLRGDSATYAEDTTVQSVLRQPAIAPPAPEQQVRIGDDFNRRAKYTPPRTITLDTKYDGAVSILVWTGYAVLVVSKIGERKVIVGPQTYLLAYDESLEPMVLSTGCPKSEQELLRTVYLRVLHNKVSDCIRAETQDLCEVDIELSYRVNFEGEPNQWFDVENYVKFLTEHMRSLVRNAVKQLGVDAFYSNSIDILRNTVLGSSVDGERRGRLFPENGMRVYDVEVLKVALADAEVENMLVKAQRSVVEQTLQLGTERRRLDFVRAQEDINREVSLTRSVSRQQALELQLQEMSRELDVKLGQARNDIALEAAKLDARLGMQAHLGEVHDAELSRQKATTQAEIDAARARLDHRLTALRAEVEAVVDKAHAISPDFIAALQAFGDKALAERMAESMAPLAILGGKSVADVLSQLLRGTRLESLMMTALPNGDQLKSIEN